MLFSCCCPFFPPERRLPCDKSKASVQQEVNCVSSTCHLHFRHDGLAPNASLRNEYLSIYVYKYLRKRKIGGGRTSTSAIAETANGQAQTLLQPLPKSNIQQKVKVLFPTPDSSPLEGSFSMWVMLCAPVHGRGSEGALQGFTMSNQDRRVLQLLQAHFLAFAVLCDRCNLYSSFSTLNNSFLLN